MDDAALDALLDEFGTWDDAAAFLELTSESDDPSERTHALVRLGYVRALHLDDAEGALDAWDAIDDEHAPEDDAFVRAWARACETRERFADAAAAYVDLAGGTADVASRTADLLRAAHLYLERLEQPEAATLILGRLLRDAAPDEALELLERAGLAQDDPAAVANILRDAVPAAVARDGETAGARLQTRLGSWLAEQLGQIDEARIRWEAAAVADPSLHEPIDRLIDDLSAAGDDRAARAWLQRGFEAALDADRRVALATRLASLHLDAGAADEAAAVLALAYADAPDNDELAATLTGALERTGDGEALADVLRGRIGRAGGDDRAALRLRLARVLSDLLDDADGALTELRRAREDADRDDVRAALIEALTDGSAPTELADVLAAQAASAPADAGALYARLADVRYDDLGDVDGALEAIEHAIGASPHDADLRARQATWLRDAERWSALADALEAHATTGLAGATNALLELASVRAERLNDDAGAIEALDALLSEAPDHADALHLLAGIYEARGDVANALPLRQRLAGDDAGAEALARVARLTAGSGEDGAVDAYERAIEAAPGDASLRRELATLLAEAGRVEEAVADLKEGASYVTSLPERAALLVFAGELLLDVLERPDDALSTLERAWELDPEQVAAAAILADLYLARELWERVPPLVPVLLTDPRYGDRPAEAARVHQLEGLCLAELGRHEESAAAYRRALDVEPSDNSARLALADALMRADRPGDAAGVYAEISVADITDITEYPAHVCLDAARAHRAAGELDAAVAWYGLALEHDPALAIAQRELAELDAERAGDDPIARLRAWEQQLAATADDLERFALLDRIGETRALLGDVDAALLAWRDAAALGQDARGPLRRALAVTMESERWSDASGLLTALAELESDASRRARLHMTLGALHRDHLDDPNGAIEHFEAALADDPTLRDAFDAAADLQRERGDWEGLQRTLRRDYERHASDNTADGRRRRFELCRELGIVLTDRLHRPDDAWAAFRLATRLDPDDADVLERLTRTYPSEGKTDADVIDEHLALLRVRPDRIDSYHLLFAALRRSRRMDFAWRVAGILRTFDEAEPAELAFYNEHRPARVPTATGVIGSERWPQIAHHEVDYLLSRVFAALAPIVGPAYEVPLRQLGIHPRRDRLELDADTPVASLARYTSTVLGVHRPNLVKHADGRGFVNARLWPPTVCVGVDVIDAPPNRALAFRVARAIALMRPEYQLASAWRASAPLRTFIYGAIAAFTGRVLDASSSDAIEACARTIRSAPDEQQRVLWSAVQALTQADAALDVSRWLRGVEFTANRAGLLICGDLERAIEAMAAVREPLAGTTTRDRIADLVAWSLSRDCEDLRADLGLGIGQQSG